MKQTETARKPNLIWFCFVTEAILILSVALANLNPNPVLYCIFYNLFYGLIFSFLVPLSILRKEKTPLSSVGIKKPGARQWIVLIAFALCSAGGQLIPTVLAGEPVRWDLLPVGIVPLIMTTFFEEFLFRGFIQTRVEQRYGFIAGILVSGLMFSLYHLGYPGFRTGEDLLLLFAVGLGFATAYKLSGNHLFVSFFVNLPNALIRYVLKYEQFPTLRVSSAIASGVTLAGILLISYGAWRADSQKK